MCFSGGYPDPAVPSEYGSVYIPLAFVIHVFKTGNSISKSFLIMVMMHE